MQYQRHTKIMLILITIVGLFFPATGISQNSIPHRGLSIKDHSSFIDKIEVQSYEAVDPPNDAILYRWDFSDNKEYSYKFIQKVVTQNLMTGMGPDSKDTISLSKMSGDGKLSYKSEKNNTARFVLEDLRLKAEHSSDDPNAAPKTMEMKQPPMVLQGVKEDGNLIIPTSSQSLLLKLLFPLPEKPMKVSETTTVEANLPFNAMGSLLYIKGFSKITLTKCVRINGYRCAKFVSNIDISKMDIPPEIKGKFVAFAKGKSVFYFDIERRKFISGNLALLMAMDIETESPQMTYSDNKEQSQAQPKKVKLIMNGDNLISLDIIEN